MPDTYVGESVLRLEDEVLLTGGASFVDVAVDVGWGEGNVSRGIATADFDNDGDLDVLVTHQFDPASLYRNDSDEKSWLGLELVGNAQSCNRDATGSRVWISFPPKSGQPQQSREVTSANGFSAQADRRLLFGLGDYVGEFNVDISWCGATKKRVAGLNANQYHRIEQATASD